MTALARILAAAAALSLMAAPAHAQNLNTGSTGTYGQIQLRAGFVPDPHNVTLNAGGAIDATRADEACGGYVDRRASFTLRYTAGERPLYIGAVSDADTTIAVRAPNGAWYCDDDSGGGLNPLVSLEAPRSGRYQIWVGRFGVQGETAPAVLHISEIGGPGQPAPSENAALPDFSLDPAYGTVDLVSGFQPDPHEQAIQAGGSLSASAIPGCVGWIAQAPDYRINWTAGSGALPLVFSVDSDADTVLVINDAQGNWVCDDDGGNKSLNPSITFQNPASGQYDVWVGTFSEGDLQPSVLNVSELYSQ
jgi:hypothetical protein